MTTRRVRATVELHSVLECLRVETRTLHQRVEKRVDLPRRCATKDTYRGLLVQMLGVHAAVEAVLSRLDWTTSGIDLAKRHKTHHIHADLMYLDGQDVGQPPPRGNVPELRTQAEGFGGLYIVEGLTLGGQYRIREALDSAISTFEFFEVEHEARS